KKTEERSKKKQLENVPIVWNYLKVFSKDLPGLPLTRQVKFQINLLPNAAYVARPPYRLAPSEMQELSSQLQELSDKGFIISTHWRNKKEHKEHVKLIFGLLKKDELYAKFSMCGFWLPKVQFIGHVVDSRGIHVDPAKIKSIKDWATLTTPIEIR
ncbi:hypothetical protein Tco_0062064, partial [Tanacetum coccineum]